MTNLNQTGALIAQLRKEHHLTQAQLAAQLNVSHQAVSKWERGQALPDVALLPHLARVLGCTVDQLLSGTTAQVTEPEQITWATPSEGRPRVSILPLTTYLVLFASTLGFYTINNTPGLLWIGMGFFGGILLLVKNYRFNPQDKRNTIFMLDLAAMLAVAGVGSILPPYWGLVKQLAMAAVGGIYTTVMCRKYYSENASE